MRRFRPGRLVPFAGLGFLVLWCVAGVGPTRGEEPTEPWRIEGEELSGSRTSGTEITRPIVTHGGLRLTADQGRLTPDQETAIFHGNVRMADTSRTITAADGTYRRTSRILDLTGGVRGRGTEGDFESDELTFDRLSGWLFLRGSPKLTEPDRLLWAQRIEYDTGRRAGQAWGDVRVLLLPDSTRLYGGQADYDDASGRMVLTDEPRLVNPARAGEPELRVLADTLIFNEQTRSGLALGSVRILRGELNARGRRARLLLDEGRMILTGDPYTWDRDGEIRADSMVVRIQSGRAEELRAWGNVRVRYEPADKPGERNLVLGDTLTAGLNDGAVRDLEVTGRAVSLYLPALSEVDDGTGRNLSEARRIRVSVAGGQAHRVDLLGSAHGSYAYPSEKMQDRFREPAFRDSVVPDWLTRPFSDPTGLASPQGPPPLPPVLAEMLRARELTPPESLATPFDELFDERVAYEGDTIRFDVPEDRIRIRGNGFLRYRESELRSSAIDYEAGTHLVTALGAPELADQTSKVVGRKMTYRTDEREGIVYRGRTEFDGGYYYGREVKKLPGDALLVRQGDYTTCEEDSAPHYHFHASRMKLIMKDKAVARPVVLYLRNIPVLALPFYIFPLKHGRASGIMMPNVEVGLSRSAGRFVRNLGYYWAISDYMDAKAWIDYYDRGPRFYWNGEYQYRVRYLLNGKLTASVLRESDTYGNRRRRWSVVGSHRQELGRQASLTAQANFSSDKDYRSDQSFGSTIDDQLNRKLTSSLALQKAWSKASGNVSLQRVQYLDETTGSGLKYQVAGPSADLRLNSRPLGRAPDASGRGGKRAFLSSTTVSTGFAYRRSYARTFDGKISTRQAAQQTLGLADTRKLGPFLRLSPSVNANMAIFGRDNLRERWSGGASWSGGVGAGTTLWGTFGLPVGPLAGLRHVIEPSAGWRYAPELRNLTYRDSTGVRRNRFPSVEGIGLSGTKSSALSFSLSQRFHAKWRFGEKVIKQENLLSWSTSSSYNLLTKRLPGTAKARRWSTISNSLSFRPTKLIEATASTTHQPYTLAPQSFNFGTGISLSTAMFRGAAGDSAAAAPGIQYGDFGYVANPTSSGRPTGAVSGGAAGGAGGAAGKPPADWNLSLSYNYATSQGSARATNRLPVRLGGPLTENWRIESSVYLDLRTREVISHAFTLSRELHCWALRFSYDASGTRSQFFFNLSVKQIPEVKYERERR